MCPGTGSIRLSFRLKTTVRVLQTEYHMRQILIFCFLLVFPAVIRAEKTLKVACVGNSITYGAGIAGRENNSYPAQLQQLPGEGYRVENFGHNGATAASWGDYPYTDMPEFERSKEFAPDIVLLKLGTSDTRPQNWRGAEPFAAELGRLADTYRNLPSHPQVIVLTPVRCFLTGEGTISPQKIAGEVRPAVEKLACERGLGIINLFNLFGDRWDATLMPDRLHPSAIGAGMIARKVGDYLLAGKKGRKPSFVPEGATAFCFHGFRGYDFRSEGTDCKVVCPAREAEGRPWVWRARFWGHEPQTDIDLLEKGFHIVCCDVADLYGSDKATERRDRFYRYLRKHGFHRKAVLEGMSRGGLIVYNWAAKNPDKVACIYADAPVMDITSWPMGKGTSEGSAEDTRRMMEVYGFGSEQEAAEWKGNPLDHAGRIARAGIPVLHVAGDADTVVPVAENRPSSALAQQSGTDREVYSSGYGTLRESVYAGSTGQRVPLSGRMERGQRMAYRGTRHRGIAAGTAAETAPAGKFHHTGMGRTAQTGLLETGKGGDGPGAGRRLLGIGWYFGRPHAESAVAHPERKLQLLPAGICSGGYRHQQPRCGR